MVNHRRVLLMLALLLLTSFSPALMSTKITPFSESLEFVEPEYSEQQKLQMATMNWHRASSMILGDVEANMMSEIVHLSAGSFDPLTTSGPKVSEFLQDELDYLNTGFAILQLEYFSSANLEELQSQYGFKVLDYLGESTMLIRLSENTVQAFEEINEDSGVRWLGNMHPGWRVSSEILEYQTLNNLMLIPSDDLSFGGFEKLVLDLTHQGPRNLAKLQLKM